MDRRAFLAALTAAIAALAFAVGAAAFVPTLEAPGDAADGDGELSPAEDQRHGPGGAAGDTEAGTGFGGCSWCDDLDVQSLVASALPAVDPRLLLGALALATAALAAVGLRSDRDAGAAASPEADDEAARRTQSEAASRRTRQLDAAPTNGVYRAWRAMAARTDAPHAATTPRQYAREAEAAGLPGDAVDRLTDSFERVRYGESGPTDRLEREATAALDSIEASAEPSTAEPAGGDDGRRPADDREPRRRGDG